MKLHSPLIALAAGFSLVSCMPSTPLTRIEKNPQLFQALPEKHKALVQQGQIERGMSKEAVFLAWGRPSRTTNASYSGKISERWDYEGSRPVYSYSVNPTFGFSRLSSCMHYSYFGASIGPDITYLPTTVASVWYLNHRVDSWEQTR